MGRTQRRYFLTAAGALVAASLAAEAQAPVKIARIGFIDPGLPDTSLFEALRQGLRDLGYVEGRNILIEFRTAQGKPERFPALAAELVALKVDVIVTGAGTLAAQAAQHASSTLPIVAVAIGDPVTSRLVSSLARPGGNVTGLSVLTPELAGKCLEQLKLAVSSISRVAILLQPGAVPERTQMDILSEAEVAARALGMHLQVVEARGAEDFDRAFSNMISGRADAMFVLSTPVFSAERRRLVELAAKNRFPAMYSFRVYVDAGGLMSYGPNVVDLSRRAATYVDKILKGAKPGDLPVEQPTKFELVINLKAAKYIGLTIPQSMIARADDVIQ